jgi:CzcA family heavy metal efflux pump
MIRSIVGTSLRFRLLILGIAAAVIVVGIVQLRNAPTDVLPEFTPPYVEVQTEALGLSAEEVEQLITVPLEADLLNGVEGIDTLRSESVPGLSSITMVFEPGTDIYKARQLVQEPLTQAHALPNVSKAPTMLQPLSSSSRVMMVAISGDKLSDIDKSVIARWTMRPRLMGVPGVANVSIFGMRDQQLQVQVDPRTLRDKDVTLRQVIETTGNAQVASPVSYLEASTPGTGGFIETPQQRLQVRNVFDNIATPKELGRVPVEGTNGRLRLTDVSNVVKDHQPLIGDAIVNDKSGLLLVVEKFPGANTTEVTEGVESALEKLQPGLAGIQTDSSVFRPASFIEDAKDNLTLAIIIAGILLALALVAFLFQWRTVVIALVTIPVSLVAAALVLDLMGETFNAISFAGLAVALAIVIDDAVAGAEAVGRRIRAEREAGGNASIAQMVTEAMQAVRSPLSYATLIALLTIVPIAIMEGRPGAFFEPLALAYALAIVAAMVVALTVTPALSAVLFGFGSAGDAESPLLARVRGRYNSALGRVAGAPGTVAIAAGACVLVAAIALPLLGTSLVPSFKDRDVIVGLSAEPGTSQPRMTDIATQVSNQLRGLEGVDNVAGHVGRAVGSDQRTDVNRGELYVSIDSGADYDKTFSSIEDAVEEVPGVRTNVTTYSGREMSDVGALEQGDNPNTGNGLDVLTGTDRPLAVRVFGQDQQTLRREAAKIQQLVAGVDGVKNPRIETPTAQPELQIEVDIEKARGEGIKPGDVRRAEATLLQGIEVGSVFEDQKVFEVIVKGTPATRRNVESVRNLLIDKPDGGHVRLGDVATVRIAQTPAVIKRDAVSRYLDIEADVSGRSLSDVSNDIENRLQDVSLPLEYHAEVLQEATSKEINSTAIILFSLAAAIAAYLILQAAFGSWRLAALAFLTLPVALVGGAVGVLINGAELKLGALIGLLALFALAARNGLVLIRHFQDLERTGGESFGAALVTRGAQERLAPVLASAAAIALAMLPFVLMGSTAGLEVINPMAIVILCGLVSSTALALFVLPSLYLRYGSSQADLTPEDDLLHRWASGEPAAAGAAERTTAVPASEAGKEDRR